MQRCIISISSPTIAQKGRNILADYAVRTEVVSLNSSETKHGCAYGLDVNCGQLDGALRILDRHNINYKEIIRRL